LVRNVRAIHALEIDEVVNAVGDADVMAISVGKGALPVVASVVAAGLLLREQKSPGRALDIILAENMRSANLFFRERLLVHLPGSYPIEKRVGLVETSIGKMVPIMTTSDLETDPLQVFAEPYNTLILDKNGFKGAIPPIREFALKENMKAWVDRKAFIHNLGHATAAFAGNLKYPQALYMYEILADPKIREFTKGVMEESADILRAAYPGEFTAEDLTLHIEDLMDRFQNKNLGDTIFRVGSDLQRKLGPDDRFMGIIHLAQKHNISCDMILKATARGFHFRATDENNQMFPGDVEFHQMVSTDLDAVIEKICGLNISKEATLVSQLKYIIRSTS
jgi:mannitol-1-phosphate 5-dehydrogenase